VTTAVPPPPAPPAIDAGPDTGSLPRTGAPLALVLAAGLTALGSGSILYRRRNRRIENS
jgi:LPXTG-motif cell wall-anchored protein